MINVPFADVVAKLKEQTGLSEEEINRRVDEKVQQLSGLVSRDGAAHIIANELGVKVFQHGGRQKIKDLLVGQRSVDVLAKVRDVYEARDFTRSDGTAGKVGSLLVADETGTTRVVLWGDQTAVMRELKPEALILIRGGSVRDNNRGFKEVHLGDSGALVVDPIGESMGAVQQPQKATRKAIKDLAENDENVELLGTVVQIFDPKFFEMCPECGKRVQTREGRFWCEAHKEVRPEYGYLLTVFLDDGSQNVRTVFFRNQVDRLLNSSSDKMQVYREMPEKFEEMKTQLLGQIIKVTGRVKKNTFFDRLEFNAQSVVPDPDPQEELQRLNDGQQAA